jgi:hypothetical protein
MLYFIALVEYKILLKYSLKQFCKVVKIIRSVLRVLLCYCFTIDLYKLREYIRPVASDRDNIPCTWVYVDGVRMKVKSDSSV